MRQPVSAGYTLAGSLLGQKTRTNRVLLAFGTGICYWSRAKWNGTECLDHPHAGLTREAPGGKIGPPIER
jgi:hypothetical protein